MAVEESTDLKSLGVSGTPKLEVTNDAQLRQLKDSMQNFFAKDLAAAEDSTSFPLEKKENEPAAETPNVETPAPKQEAPVTTPEAPAAAPAEEPSPELPAPEEPDPEFDGEAYQLPDNTRDEISERFRGLRTRAKETKREAAALHKQLEAAQAELEAVKKFPTQVPEGLTREVEELRSFRRMHDLANDPTFKAKYEHQIQGLEKEICDTIAGLEPDSKELQDYVDKLRKAGPRSLPSNWWHPNLIKNMQDQFVAHELMNKVQQMYQLAKNQKTEIEDWSKDGDKFKAHQAQLADQYWKNFATVAAQTVKAMIPQLGDFGKFVEPKDETKATNSSERAAWAEHNASRKPLEEMFQKLMIDAHDNGPAGLARVCTLAVKGDWDSRELTKAKQQIAELNDKLARAQGHLDGIVSKQKVVGGAKGQAPGPTAAPPKKLGASVQDAFKAHGHIFGQ
jgi:hypothetical protein